VTKLIALALFAATIKRGSETIPVEAAEHELEVLRVVHGPNALKIIGKTGETREFNPDAGAEIQRLQRAYRRANAPDPVALAFPLAAHSLEKYGFERGNGPVAAAPQAGVRRHAKAKADEGTAKLGAKPKAEGDKPALGDSK
jgi:hypothetical protein